MRLVIIMQGMRMKYIHIVSIAVSIFSCTQSIAGSMGSIDAPTQDWRWIGSVSIGPIWEDAGQTQTFYLAPNIIKTYAAAKPSHVLADGEVFVGIQKELPKAFLGQLGLAVAVTSNAKLSGNIWDDADSTFNNYSYGYQIQHTQVAVKGALLQIPPSASTYRALCAVSTGSRSNF